MAAVTAAGLSDAESTSLDAGLGNGSDRHTRFNFLFSSPIPPCGVEVQDGFNQVAHSWWNRTVYMQSGLQNGKSSLHYARHPNGKSHSRTHCFDVNLLFHRGCRRNDNINTSAPSNLVISQHAFVLFPLNLINTSINGPRFLF